MVLIMIEDKIKTTFEQVGGTYTAMVTGLPEARISYLARLNKWKRPTANEKRFNVERILKNYFINI